MQYLPDGLRLAGPDSAVKMLALACLPRGMFVRLGKERCEHWLPRVPLTD